MLQKVRDFLQRRRPAHPPENGPTNSLGKAYGTIYVWYIYLHLVDVSGKCRQIYQFHGSKKGVYLPRYGLIPLRHHGFILYSEARLSGVMSDDGLGGWDMLGSPPFISHESANMRFCMQILCTVGPYRI